MTNEYGIGGNITWVKNCGSLLDEGQHYQTLLKKSDIPDLSTKNTNLL